MQQCRTALPPLYRTERARAAACLRLSEWPVLPAEDVGQVLRREPLQQSQVSAI
jgi:hypothetical protein